jgi:tape measure domain-containing protein
MALELEEVRQRFTFDLSAFEAGIARARAQMVAFQRQAQQAATVRMAAPAGGGQAQQIQQITRALKEQATAAQATAAEIRKVQTEIRNMQRAAASSPVRGAGSEQRGADLALRAQRGIAAEAEKTARAQQAADARAAASAQKVANEKIRAEERVAAAALRTAQTKERADARAAATAERAAAVAERAAARRAQAEQRTATRQTAGLGRAVEGFVLDLGGDDAVRLRVARAQETLNAALRRGVIDSTRYNELLERLRVHYADLDAGATGLRGKLRQLAPLLSGQAVASAVPGIGGFALGAAAGRSGVGAAVGITAAIGAGAAAIGIQRASDRFATLNAQLETFFGNSRDAQTAFQGLIATSQQTGTSIEDNAVLLRRLALAQDDLGISTNDLIQFQRTIAQMLVTTGATSIEASSATVQLAQALASGKVQGDEFRTILEAFPALAQAAARGLFEMGVATTPTIGALNQLREAGALTARDFVRAVQTQADEAEANFKRMPETLERATTRFSNSWSLLQAQMGETLGVNITSFVSTIGTGLDDLTKFLKDFKTEVGSVVDFMTLSGSELEAFARRLRPSLLPPLLEPRLERPQRGQTSPELVTANQQFLQQAAHIQEIREELDAVRTEAAQLTDIHAGASAALSAQIPVLEQQIESEERLLAVTEARIAELKEGLRTQEAAKDLSEAQIAYMKTRMGKPGQVAERTLQQELQQEIEGVAGLSSEERAVREFERSRKTVLLPDERKRLTGAVVGEELQQLREQEAGQQRIVAAQGAGVDAARQAEIAVRAQEEANRQNLSVEDERIQGLIRIWNLENQIGDAKEARGLGVEAESLQAEIAARGQQTEQLRIQQALLEAREANGDAWLAQNADQIIANEKLRTILEGQVAALDMEQQLQDMQLLAQFAGEQTEQYRIQAAELELTRQLLRELTDEEKARVAAIEQARTREVQTAATQGLKEQLEDLQRLDAFLGQETEAYRIQTRMIELKRQQVAELTDEQRALVAQVEREQTLREGRQLQRQFVPGVQFRQDMAQLEEQLGALRGAGVPEGEIGSIRSRALVEMPLPEPLEDIRGVTDATVDSLIGFSAELATGTAQIEQFGDVLLDIAGTIYRAILEAAVARPAQQAISGGLAQLGESLFPAPAAAAAPAMQAALPGGPGQLMARTVTPMIQEEAAASGAATLIEFSTGAQTAGASATTFATEVTAAGTAVSTAATTLAAALTEAAAAAAAASGAEAAGGIGQLLLGGAGVAFPPGTATTTTGAGGAGFSYPFAGGPRAGGGPVSPRGIYLVGERGPEMFRPKVSGDIIPLGTHLTPRQFGGGVMAREAVLAGEVDPEVFMPRSGRGRGGGGGGVELNTDVQVINQTGAKITPQVRQDTGLRQTVEILVQDAMNSNARAGQMDGLMAGFGGRRKGTRRM